MANTGRTHFKKGHIPHNRGTSYFFKDFTGMKFGRLTVLSHQQGRNKRSSWLCVCECGQNVVVRTDRLRGHTRSCGCLQKEYARTKRRNAGTIKPGMIGRQSLSWKGGRKKCIDCSKQLSNYSGTRCQPCNGTFLSGINSPCWIVDRTKLAQKQERNDMAYKEWRRQVWVRDGFMCKITNSDCMGRIEAHHILSWRDYPELRYQVNNGITLCRAHHPKKRAEEKRLIPTFLELVSVSDNYFA